MNTVNPIYKNHAKETENVLNAVGVYRQVHQHGNWFQLHVGSQEKMSL